MLLCDDGVEVSLDQSLEHGSVLGLHEALQHALVIGASFEVFVGGAFGVNDRSPKKELSGDEGALQSGVLGLNVKALSLIGDGMIISREHGQPMLENEREVSSLLTNRDHGLAKGQANQHEAELCL